MKTIEEKAKAYDEALERAKAFHRNELSAGSRQEIAEYIFPELRESEDERIRKKLIGIFTNQSLCDVYNLKSEDVLAYLERQKELLTPEEKMKHPLYVEGFEAGKQVGTQYEAVFGKQKEQKPMEHLSVRDEFDLNGNPKQKPTEWSEEDEKKIHFLSRLIEFQVKDDEYCFGDGTMITKQGAVEMLKSLRPYWKPSDKPVWRIWKNGACGNSEGNPIALVKTYGGYKLVSCLGADGEKYIMLSDLEKLPGFNEK